MSEEKIELRNIDNIIKYFKSKLKTIVKLDKTDGITIECFVEKNSSRDDGTQEVTKLCKKLKLIPYQIELNKSKDNVFILQFPELVPSYNDKEIQKLYTKHFKWLLDGLIKRDPQGKITKDIIKRFQDTVIKEAIVIYYKSNTNMYKEKVKDYLNNTNYRHKIRDIYLAFIETYKIGD